MVSKNTHLITRESLIFVFSESGRLLTSFKISGLISAVKVQAIIFAIDDSLNIYKYSIDGIFLDKTKLVIDNEEKCTGKMYFCNNKLYVVTHKVIDKTYDVFFRLHIISFSKKINNETIK